MDSTALSTPSDKQVIVQNVPPLKDVWPESETAELLGITVRTLREWHYRRIGPPRVTFRQMICYRRESVLAWLEKFESKPRQAEHGDGDHIHQPRKKRTGVKR